MITARLRDDWVIFFRSAQWLLEIQTNTNNKKIMLVTVGIMVKNDEGSRGNLMQKSEVVLSFPLQMDVLWTFKLHFQTSCFSPELCSAGTDSRSRLLAQPRPNYRHDSHSGASSFTYTCNHPMYQACPDFSITSTNSLFFQPETHQTSLSPAIFWIHI